LTARAARRCAPLGRAFAFHAPLCGACGAKAKIQKQEIPMQQTERKPLFDLGQLVATPGALAALEKSGQNAMEFLSRHVKGD